MPGSRGWAGYQGLKEGWVSVSAVPGWVPGLELLGHPKAGGPGAGVDGNLVV
jgi:hypothetical protein